LPQFERDRQFTYDDAAEGMRQILCGLFKKLVLADGLAQIVDIIYGDPGSFIGPALALATVAFAFQIYFDFSAYSDIARGSARLFGFELMINFNYPYLSASVTEFWRRWHVSLSTWFRDYVYIPLGGNRVGRGRLATNLLITFGLSGLWHGASWNFVIWGLLNGVLLLPAALGVSRSARSASTSLGLVLHVARVVRTFALICLGWVFFRAATFGDAVLILQRIFTLGDYFRFSMLDQAYKQFIEPPQYFSVWMALLATMVVECVMQRREHPLSISDWPTPVRWAVYSAVLWGAAILMAPERGQFIYFQF
jgi:D-alanyl-lipoteichoic acid acyltransferase DltB (MBOAT superfamily)